MKPLTIGSVIYRHSVLALLLVYGVLFQSTPGAAQAAPELRELPLQPGASGDWIVPAGRHQGPFELRQSGRVRCAPGAVIEGGGRGTALRITAPEVHLQACEIRDWGADLTALDSGIFLARTARGAVIVDNRLVGPGFGVWVDATKDVEIRRNTLVGDASLRSQDRGNGIHLYAVAGARVIDNEIREVRDGIYIDTSNNNTLEGNRLSDLRYGIHYMFSHSNRVIGNSTRRTRTGYALMQSRSLTVLDNLSEEDQNYGILMNYITYSTLRGNRVIGVRQGTSGDTMISGAEGKALFIYNSVFNVIEDNHFAQSTLGIHLTAGSEDNRISGNAFLDNQQQVKYVATRRQEWSVDQRGNYWSDYLGWDRNGDGIGDVLYEPNDNVDRLLWVYPEARLLMHSPAIELMRWVQRAFPVIRSPGVQDSHPLMRPPTRLETAS